MSRKPTSVEKGYLFRRYELQGLTSLAPIIESRRCGVYILEFANGERYVGQSVDLRQRFAQHVHGSGHEPWNDVVAFSFVDVPVTDLNQVEAEMIENQLSEGRRLRNRRLNFDYQGSAVIDGVISVEDQNHWACGKWALDCEAFERAAQRPVLGSIKLQQSKVGNTVHPILKRNDDGDVTFADAVIYDLVHVLTAIPAAVDLERRYWTVSDYPSTAGARLTTLNVGELEVYACSRRLEEYTFVDGDSFQDVTAFINLPPGSIFEHPNGDSGSKALPEAKEQWLELAEELPVLFEKHPYSLTLTDVIAFPVGCLASLLEVQFVREAFQNLILKLLRRGECGLFRRWYSEDLATLMYKEVWRLIESGELSGL